MPVPHSSSLLHFFPKTFFARENLQLSKWFAHFQKRLLQIQELVSKREVEQTDAYDDVPSGNLILDPMGQIP